jgi:hypothetical protein
VLLWLARLCSTIGYQMLAVAIGWQVYQITNSAFDLGLVGLIQFVPAVVLTLLIGHAADRYDRRLIVRTAQGVYALAAVMITLALLAGVLSRDLLFGAVFLIGSARAFESPTMHSLVPALVPPGMIARAVAAWTSANQVAVICGPALGGLIYTISPTLVSALCLVFFTASITLVSFVRTKGPVANPEPPTLASVLAGLEFIRTRHRATADLCARYPGGGADRLRIAALGAGGRRVDHLDRAVALSGRTAHRAQDVRRDGDLRRDDNCIRAVDLVSALAADAGRAWRVRCVERRDPLFAGADRNAQRKTRACERDQLPVRRFLEYARRIRIRHGRRLARPGIVGADRRAGLVADRRRLDAIIPRPAPHRPFRAGG